MQAGSKPIARGGPASQGTAPAPSSLYDPHAPDAMILNRAQWAEGRGKLPDGRPVLPVVVDPYLASKLRPHQVCEETG